MLISERDLITLTGAELYGSLFGAAGSKTPSMELQM